MAATGRIRPPEGIGGATGPGGFLGRQIEQEHRIAGGAARRRLSAHDDHGVTIEGAGSVGKWNWKIGKFDPDQLAIFDGKGEAGGEMRG